MRTDSKAFYRPLWAALLTALTVSLAGQGMARAVEFNPRALADAQLPDAVQGPGADRIPPGLACTDNMDQVPQGARPGRLATGSAAYRAGHHRTMRQPVSIGGGCPDFRPPHTDTV
jgi:hypothetical protein